MDAPKPEKPKAHADLELQFSGLQHLLFRINNKSQETATSPEARVWDMEL